MLEAFLFLILGLAVLSFGADWLVRGGGSIAIRAGITPLVVGLTVVAFGTSAPELVVSVKASMEGAGSMAIGNVVGSNIFNIGAILGLSALVSPLIVKPQLTRFDMPLLIGVTLLFSAMFHDQVITRIEGGILFTGVVIYTVYSILKARKEVALGIHDANEDDEIPTPSANVLMDIGFVIAGCLGLYYGGKLLVDNAVILAKFFGMSDAVVGLTVVSAGTSAPELITSIVASMRKQTDIAIGNVVGSNLFNLLSVIGAAGLIHPIHGGEVVLLDILVMNGLTILLLGLMLRGMRLFRGEGLILLAIHLSYMTYLLLQTQPSQ